MKALRASLAVVACAMVASTAALAASGLTRPSDRTAEFRRVAAAMPGAGPADIAKASVARIKRQVATRGDGRAPKTTWQWLKRPSSNGLAASFRVRVRGFADDSVGGWNVTVDLRKQVGEGVYSTTTWTVRKATRQLFCSRGANAARTKCR